MTVVILFGLVWVENVQVVGALTWLICDLVLSAHTYCSSSSSFVVVGMGRAHGHHPRRRSVLLIRSSKRLSRTTSTAAADARRISWKPATTSRGHESFQGSQRRRCPGACRPTPSCTSSLRDPSQINFACVRGGTSTVYCFIFELSLHFSFYYNKRAMNFAGNPHQNGGSIQPMHLTRFCLFCPAHFALCNRQQKRCLTKALSILVGNALCFEHENMESKIKIKY
jgi:hypothetical protein